MITPVLPTYNRANLAFERGEGVRVYTAEGDGISRFRRGRRGDELRPCPSPSGRGADRAGRRSSGTLPISTSMPGQEQLARRLIEADFRRHGVLHQFGRRGAGMRDQDGAQISRRQRQPRALPDRHLRRRLPWPHACHHRRRRPGEISRRLRTQGRGLRPGALRRSRGRSRRRSVTRPRASCIEPVQGEGGMRPVPPHGSGRLRELCDETRHPSDPRRSPVRHRPHRQAFRP